MSESVIFFYFLLNMGVVGAIKGFFGGLLGIGGENSEPAPEAKLLHDGDLYIQLDSENRRVTFAISEDNKSSPMMFDLKDNLIYNASFPVAEENQGSDWVGIELAVKAEMEAEALKAEDDAKLEERFAQLESNYEAKIAELEARIAELEANSGSGSGSGSGGITGDYVPVTNGNCSITNGTETIALQNRSSQLQLGGNSAFLMGNGSKTFLDLSSTSSTLRAGDSLFLYIGGDSKLFTGFAPIANEYTANTDPSTWTNVQMIDAKTVYWGVRKMFDKFRSHNNLSDPWVDNS
jgi:hypothetical protein